MVKQVKKKKSAKKRPLTVSEAGQKGGKKTHALYGKTFYEGIGRMGGARVRELIAAGRAGEAKLAAEPASKVTKTKKSRAHAIFEEAITVQVKKAKQ